MAKNTQHKALASLGQKLKECQKKYNDLRGWYEGLRKDHATALQDIERIKGARDRAIQYGKEDAEALRDLRAQMQSRQIVSARAYQQVSDGLRDANDQVVNLQNRNAALRNKVESAVQGGIIYGTLVAIAAYAAGIATQHWFPITF